MGVPFSTSDHCTVDFCIVGTGGSDSDPSPNNFNSSCNSTTSDSHEPVVPVYDWSHADFASINSVLQTFDWNLLFGYYFDSESLWYNFKQILWSVIVLYVPTKPVHHSNKYNIRKYPKNIRQLLSRKAAIWRTLSSLRLSDSSTSSLNADELFDKYRRVANECKQAILNYDIACEERILKANSLGKFFRFVNNKIGRKSGIAPLLDQNGCFQCSDQAKADLLNQYFYSVFTHDNGQLPEFKSRVAANDPGICDVIITPGVIRKFILKLKSSTGAGPDGLPACFFKNTVDCFVFPLHTLFRSIVDLHVFPSDWKKSVVTPIFKKGDPSELGNYRPIALTCICCKLLESIIVSNLLDYLNDRKLINKCQHGFLKNHSCITSLLESCRDWSISLAAHTSVVVANIDFQKAFDTVSHTKLLHKLSGYGIHGNLFHCISSFLSDRLQRVRVGSFLSNYCSVCSGIPQGSVIGPLLFNLFINDLTDNLNSSVTTKLFADDVTMYSNISHVNSCSDF